ncbi:MAG TPA: RsmD family RNA methyltransferase [Planctomycetota bacterium]|nr:RsmD family RNA methyltransferase [Planctomycetota bacterium]MDP7245177.1 RsmD family RNA methyltransferase [Planctomycetota bacterium]HJM39454.1 RsmD family RNA methyltransferase [Planctomycetota bacterium]|tara:strand:+ start:3792 stop:4373 length:582 start_codon:yes stop_codon:yes gene_type:complete
MLRITAGEHRGRKLPVPDVKATRPLVERARMAVLDHMRPILEDARVWDVYAGSGILGFETLSRGASEVVAIEGHARAIRQLQETAELLGYAGRVQILRIDAHRFLGSAESELAPDVVFFDPPYKDFQGAKRSGVWELFCEMSRRLNPGGCSVVHTPRGILNPTEMGELPGLVQRDYGTTSLYWWHAPTDGCIS